MPEPESIRQIAARLIREHRSKRGARQFLREVDALPMQNFAAALSEIRSEEDLPLSGEDCDFLREMRIAI